MATLFINDNINLIGSSDTVSRVQREMTAAQTRKERDAQTFAAMCAAEAVGDWDAYSDLHKDLYGVRP